MRLPADSFLPPLARRLLSGAQLDLLAPLGFALPGEVPRLPEPGSATPDRRELAGALRRENEAIGHPGAARLAESLARPETLVVVTGQQPGLFGGPLYTVVKALAAVQWAEALAKTTGRPAVAVFWIASDDHDFREIARAYLPVADEAVEPWLRLTPREGRSDLEPVGTAAVGEEVRALLAHRRASSSSERYGRWLDRLAQLYEPEATFTAAFAQVLVEVLGAHCPLLLDSAGATVRRLQAPVLSRILARERELERALAAREREIVARGLTLQVQPQPGCPPVFALENGRRLRLRRCEPDSGTYELRGGSLRADLPALLHQLEREPERFSPSVLSRPLVQDALLGTALFVVGPGEVSYLAQAASLYEPAGVEPCTVALRPQALVLDRRRLEQVESLAGRGLGLAALLGDDEALEHQLAGLVAGDDPLAAPSAMLGVALDELARVATALEPQLASPVEKTRDQVERAVAALRGKARAATARGDEETRRRALALRDLLRPAGGLQERVLCTAHAVGLYGADLVATLRSQLDLDPRFVQLLAVDGGCGTPALVPAATAAGDAAP
ncbi:MAG TPA: bacillithiol biosynthesis cysteine-adding enzyme BshC [Thermoanaerobaculia bacterium]|nr:bacillithiol biosynthesis cysteine-adding enzyme BshC [Thermoanaerobaculia bacterium]